MVKNSNKPYPVPPHSAHGHFKVATILNMDTKIKTILDIGGTGRLQHFGAWEITNANLKGGIDGCNLPYKDDSFDAAVSIATLEHVHNPTLFLQEARRVARILVVHTYCAGDAARELETFKSSLGHSHPCIVPDTPKESTGRSVIPFYTVKEHLWCLSFLFPRKFNIPKVYTYMNDNDEIYSYMTIEEL